MMVLHRTQWHAAETRRIARCRESGPAFVCAARRIECAANHWAPPPQSAVLTLGWQQCPQLAAHRPRRRLQPAAALPVAAAGTGVLPGVLPVSGPWGVWMALCCAGAFGLWSEKNTRIGKELSGALMATLAGMFLANVGVLPAHAPELQVVFKFILPLAIPMLLFSANLKLILFSTGRLLLAFLLGSAMTLVGSAAAMALLPLGPWMGEAGWKVATALTARHIGGAVNYMAVSEQLAVPPSVFGAGLAADDLVLTIYFTSIYTLAKSIPPDSPPPDNTHQDPAASSPSRGTAAGAAQTASTSAPATTHADPTQPDAGGHSGPKKSIQVLEGLMAVSLSAAICYVSHSAAAYLSAPTQALTILTGVTVFLATLMPGRLAPLVPSAEGLAQILMQLFYATIGASADVGLVVRTAPVLFLYCAIALAVHLVGLLLVGRALGFSQRDLLIASNANIGGPSTVAGMCAAKGWTSVIVPGILTSTLGYSIGSFLGLGLGNTCLLPWSNLASA